jgi:predicted PurR-regulated permease PerM
MGPLVKTQVTALFKALPDIARQVEQVWLPTLFGWLKLDYGEDVGIGAFFANYSDTLSSWSGKFLLGVGKSGGAVVMAVLSLFLIPIITFYMLRDWDAFKLHLVALLPQDQRETVTKLARETDDILGAFLRGQILVMMALALIYSVGLALVGLKFAIAIGVVAGLVSFVPYLGFVFGIGLAGLTVALEPNPIWNLVGVVATFTIAQAIEGTILTPKLVGDRIGLHPVLVIFAIAAGGQLFGFFGILLALPAAAVLSVLIRFAYHRYLKEHPELELPPDQELE